jgi:hypothetical protein
MKITALLIVPAMLCGAIYFNDNFEDSVLTGWTVSGTVLCAVDPAPAKHWLDSVINKDFIRIQYHGLVSMKISDRNDTEIANAINSFPTIQSATEYLVEFYYHFYPEDKSIFKNFYLYRPQVFQGGSWQSADIILKLNPIKGDSVPLSVIDGQGTHNDTYFLRPDTIFTMNYGDTFNIAQWDTIVDFPIERWYRIQIHKIKTDHIDLYINGQEIGSYTPISSSNPTRIFLGTESAAIESGVGYYDDFIITTTPQGQHPRLLYNSSELPGLRARKLDSISVLPRTYNNYWDTIIQKHEFNLEVQRLRRKG